MHGRSSSTRDVLKSGRLAATCRYRVAALSRSEGSIRALVDAEPGTRLVWSAMPDGTIIVRAKTKSILDMAGMLKAPKGKHVSVDDMNPWR